MDTADISIAICDDISIWTEKIQKQCDVFSSNFHITIEYHIYTSGLELLSDHSAKIDLLLLDIEMAGLSGLDVLNQILTDSRIKWIVFVTGYEKYMPDAFSEKTIGYLTKPPSQEAINRLIDKCLQKKRSDIIIDFCHGDKKALLKSGDILYIQGKSNYIEIHKRDGSHVTLAITLKTAETLCANSTFLRIHKSYLLNMVYIKSFNNKIMLDGLDMIFPIGKTYRTSAKEQYLDFRFRQMRGDQ